MAQRLQSGSIEEVEFERFVLEHRRLYVRIAYAIVGNRASAEESVQDVFVSLYMKWLVIPAENREAYARRVVVNTCLSRYRRFRRERLVEPDVLGAEVEAAPRGVAHPTERRLDRIQAVEALQSLSPGYRAVLVLRYLLDLPVSEVASTLRISEGAVKSQTARALARLRDQLAEVPVPPTTVAHA
jgi:RNA polymerase sigma factor (sigma-70 family)